MGSVMLWARSMLHLGHETRRPCLVDPSFSLHLGGFTVTELFEVKMITINSPQKKKKGPNHHQVDVRGKEKQIK